MGPGRSSSLRIGGDPSAASSSGRTGGTSDRSTGVVLRDAPREPPFPLNKGKGKIDEIKYPRGSEYLKHPCRMLWRWDLAESSLCMEQLSRGVIGPLLVSRSGLPTF